MLGTLKMIKGCLESAVADQMTDLANVNTAELGEVVDMIKDIAEAMYYCSKAEKNMNSWTNNKNEEIYMRYDGDYHAKTAWTNDGREGRSPTQRRIYIESKEGQHDKAIVMQKLELYAQDLVTDVLEMLQDSSPEEKSLMHKKLMALSEKVKTL